MRIFKNEKGIALVMVLVLSAITLGIMSGLLYMVTVSTQMSGVQKRYKTAFEAGLGGADVAYELIGARGDPGIPGFYLDIPALDVGGTNCLTPKLNTSTSTWPLACDYALNINPATTASFDMAFFIGTYPLEYNVRAKIVDTVEGNSAADEGLKITGVVLSNPGEIMVKSIPYLYTVEVDAQNSANAAERAKLSILYQY